MIYTASTYVQFPDLKLLIFTQFQLQIYGHSSTFYLKWTIHFSYQTQFVCNVMFCHHLLLLCFRKHGAQLKAWIYLYSLNSLELWQGWKQGVVSSEGFSENGHDHAVSVFNCLFGWLPLVHKVKDGGLTSKSSICSWMLWCRICRHSRLDGKPSSPLYLKKYARLPSVTLPGNCVTVRSEISTVQWFCIIVMLPFEEK